MLKATNLMLVSGVAELALPVRPVPALVHQLAALGAHQHPRAAAVDRHARMGLGGVRQ